MKVTMKIEGDMMLEKAGNEGHHNLQYMGGAAFLGKEALKDCKPAPKLGTCSEVVLSGSLQKANYGIGFRVEQVISCK
jgi:hypothetical protein